MTKLVKGCLSKGKRKNLADRLSRIEGQIKGIKKMLDADRYCVDILQQTSSVFEALRGVNKVLLRNYFEVCATDAITKKTQVTKDKLYDDIMDVVFKFVK